MKRLAARAAALPPRLQDLTLALALTAYNVASLIPETRQLRPAPLAYLLVVLQVLPLAWRRRWPVPVLLATGLPRSAYDQLAIGFAPLQLGPAIAYYTVMARCSTRTRVTVSVLVAAGVVQGQTTPGHVEPSDLFAALLVMAVAGMAGVLSHTRRAYVAAMEARAGQAAAEREQQLALAAAQERARIARELHDVVAHHVSLIAVQSEAAAALLPGRPAQAAKSVEVIGQTARDALTELRRLLGVLRGPAELSGRPATAPSPSVAELGEVLDQVRQAGIEVSLRVEGSPARLPPGVDLAAFRIVQEALTNTIKHSGAGDAAVTLRYEPGYVTVSVTDSGKPAARRPAGPPGPDSGPRPRRPALPGGFGLAGIAERVASCGGRLTVGPGESGGFAVSARLPAS